MRNFKPSGWSSQLFGAGIRWRLGINEVQIRAASGILNFSQTLLFFFLAITLHSSSRFEPPKESSLNKSIRVSLLNRIFYLDLTIEEFWLSETSWSELVPNFSALNRTYWMPAW